MTKRSVRDLALPTRPEIDLLLCCARTCLDPVCAERIRILLQENLDWAWLTQTAHRNGVMPLLYHSLYTTYPDTVSKAVLDQLWSYCVANLVRNGMLTSELFTLLRLLEVHDIPAVPFKGPVLAASVYGNLALRRFADLDILVHTRDVPRAAALLRAQGYRLAQEYEWETSFVDARSQVCVDLHWGITPRWFPCPLDFARMWKRRRPVSLDGTTVFTLSPEDTLLILCIQAAKDGWENRPMLAHISDIAELLRVHQHMDWGLVVQEARRLRSQRILMFGLRLTSVLLGTCPPIDVVHRLPSHPSVNALVAQVQRRLFHVADHNDLWRPRLDPFRFHSAVRECVRDKVLPYFPRYLVPNERDRAVLPLPGYLTFFYWMIRPIRLVRDYGLKWLHDQRIATK